MNIIIMLIVGGLIGWIASMIMRTNAQQGVILNIVVGIVGALLAGLLLAPLFGTGTVTGGDLSLSSLLGSLRREPNPRGLRQDRAPRFRLFGQVLRLRPVRRGLFQSGFLAVRPLLSR
jgi:uncharacterized membrane protein YeaQ/YmgE (transglycosylase-associated protein family)